MVTIEREIDSKDENKATLDAMKAEIERLAEQHNQTLREAGARAERERIVKLLRERVRDLVEEDKESHVRIRVDEVTRLADELEAQDG